MTTTKAKAKPKPKANNKAPAQPLMIMGRPSEKGEGEWQEVHLMKGTPADADQWIKEHTRSRREAKNHEPLEYLVARVIGKIRRPITKTIEKIEQAELNIG